MNNFKKEARILAFAIIVLAIAIVIHGICVYNGHLSAVKYIPWSVFRG